MKKYFCLLAGTVLVLTSALGAQIRLRPGVDIGTSIFTQTGTHTDGSAVDKDFRAALTLGGMLDVSVLNILSVEPGISFTMRGAKSPTSSSGTETAKLSYLSIPLHAKLRLPSLLVSPYAAAGVNLGILLAASSETESSSGAGSTTVDVKTDYKTVDFGLDFGGGVELNLPLVTPFIEYTYYLGLPNVLSATTGADAIKPTTSLKNSGMEIKGGVKFTI